MHKIIYILLLIPNILFSQVDEWEALIDRESREIRRIAFENAVNALINSDEFAKIREEHHIKKDIFVICEDGPCNFVKLKNGRKKATLLSLEDLLEEKRRVKYWAFGHDTYILRLRNDTTIMKTNVTISLTLLSNDYIDLDAGTVSFDLMKKEGVWQVTHATSFIPDLGIYTLSFKNMRNMGIAAYINKLIDFQLIKGINPCNEHAIYAPVDSISPAFSDFLKQLK